MIDKLKNLSLYFTCVSIFITSVFGVFKTYDFFRAKFSEVKSNGESIGLIQKEMKKYDLRFKKINLAIKKLRLKGNGKEIKKILEEEEKELEKKGKRFLGIF